MMKYALIPLLCLVVACGGEKKEEAPKTEPAKAEPAKPEAPKPVEAAPAGAPAPGAAPAGAPGAAPTAAAGGATGVPECDAYIAAIDSLSKCEKLPAPARDSMKASADQMKAAWKWDGMPEEAKKTAQAAAGTSCKQATDAVKSSMTAAGC